MSDVVFPDLKIYSMSNDGEWDFLGEIVNPENSDFDYTHASFVFDDLSISMNDKVRVAIEFNTDGPWSFVDEIDFYSDSNLKNSLTAVSSPPIPIYFIGAFLLLIARLRSKFVN